MHNSSKRGCSLPCALGGLVTWSTWVCLSNFFFKNWVAKAGLSLFIAWAADRHQPSVFEFHPSHALEFKRTAGFTVLSTQVIIIPDILFFYLFIFNRRSQGTDSGVSRCCCCTPSAEPTQWVQSWDSLWSPAQQCGDRDITFPWSWRKQWRG